MAKQLPAKIIIWSFLLFVLVFTLFPVLISVLGSLKTNAEVTAGGTFFPQEWKFSNYLEAWRQADFARFSWNSLFISTMTTVIALLISSMAGYAINRREFPGKRFYMIVQASTMFISIGAVVLRPQFELIVAMNLNASLWGIILILLGSHAAVFFMLIGFYGSIPRELDEAATIDGCSFYGVFFRIILPLLRPGLAVGALFQFRNAWNEYIIPLVFTMTNPKMQTLTVGLANLRYGYNAATQTHLMMAGACISLLPILIVYVFANRSFMQVTAGSVKG
ncbi:carbohydrate ABC transporter permease [Paenibacillus agricola]|uniref:carbohydrate ABC transporter permease n=1 Tax=Paenibacillus agricola TaxID=2716264 RepID=UPI0028937D17|nr:carbohydrate ABC transporter permease [Paenibacillus agricola]